MFENVFCTFLSCIRQFAAQELNNNWIHFFLCARKFCSRPTSEVYVLRATMTNPRPAGRIRPSRGFCAVQFRFSLK